MRVVVNGLGVISPVGLDMPTMWQNLVTGRFGTYNVKAAGLKKTASSLVKRSGGQLLRSAS